jgi:hypothetical protein
MVLGVKYLRTLGSILWDFDDMRIAFWHHDLHVLWMGISSMHTNIPPTGLLHCICSRELMFLEWLLQSFDDVFAMLSGLPQ